MKSNSEGPVWKYSAIPLIMRNLRVLLSKSASGFPGYHIAKSGACCSATYYTGDT